MARIPDGSVDMILCDLPYGTTRLAWDAVIPFSELWAQYERIIKTNGAIVLTASQPFTTDLINSNRKLFRYEIIWQKTQATGFLDANRRPLKAHENICVFFKRLPTYNPQKEYTGQSTLRTNKKGGRRAATHYNGFNNPEFNGSADGFKHPTSVLKVSNWNGALFGKTDKAVKHPTQKPVELFAWLIRTYTNAGDVVLDNCIGSGTTAVAALMEGRRHIGFEKEEKYFRIAQNRIAEAQQTLFTTSEK